MPSDAAFRLSVYLTLGLSCLCVGYAEHDLFPEVPYLAAAAALALAVLYRLEGRGVTLLSIPEANRLGAVVGLGWVGWAVYRAAREVNQPSALGGGELQLVVFVALFGPLLVILMAAKAARKEKHVGDYWGLYGLSLAAAGVSGAMADDGAGAVLIGLYAASAVWSLSLFHLRRAAGAVLPIPNRPPPPPVAGLAAAGRRGGLAAGAGLGLVAAGVAVPLYLLTPRSPGDKLEFGKPRVEVGYAADQMVDLNQAGTLRPNPAVAFEVSAEEGGRAKTDLFPEQRWRGQPRRQYAAGEWRPGDFPLPGVEPVTRPGDGWDPPRLGPGECRLTFAVPAGLRGEFLADPVAWAGGQDPPVATLTGDGPVPWRWVGNGSFYWPGRLRRGEVHRYAQVWRAGPDPDLGPPVRLTNLDLAGVHRPLVHNPVPRVKEYADRVVDDLVRAGGLPADFRDPFTRSPRPEFHDRVARALSAHLSGSGAFTYTLTLRRDRKDLDPVEEFLFHTRSGHCERFASALALMLRSQGIPAQLVLGFKGCEPAAEPGAYVVKQEHAHAWVDALIVAFEPAPPGQDRRPVSRWRALDPTPAGEAQLAPGNGGWAAGARSWLNAVFREYVADYSQEGRRRALAAVAGWAGRWEVLAVLGVVAAVVVARRFRRRGPGVGPGAARAAPNLFDRVLAVLARHGHAPQPGDTPREFAAAVGEALRRDGRTAGVAGVPGEWAEAFYESRFGDRPLPPARLAALDAGLADLARALAA